MSALPEPQEEFNMMAFTDSAERSRTVQINIQAIKSSAPNTAAQSQPPPDRIECGGITTDRKSVV